MAPVEEDRVEAALLAAKSTLIDAENARAEALERLLVLMGDDMTDDFSLSSTPAAPADLTVSADFELQMVMEGNYELRRLQKELEAAESRLQDARHAMLPELSATANVSLSGWEDEFGSALNEMINRELPGRSVGVNLTVPIANWGAKGELQQRTAEVEQARVSLENQKKTLKQQVNAQLRN